jgi:hypothetical protein
MKEDDDESIFSFCFVGRNSRTGFNAGPFFNHIFVGASLSQEM